MSTVTLYKNHGKTIGIWSISIAETSHPECKLLIQHAKSLDGKVVNSSVSVKGKNIGRANETTAYEQAQKELESRVKKQLDKGYVRTYSGRSESTCYERSGLAAAHAGCSLGSA